MQGPILQCAVAPPVSGKCSAQAIQTLPEQNVLEDGAVRGRILGHLIKKERRQRKERDRWEYTLHYSGIKGEVCHCRLMQAKQQRKAEKEEKEEKEEKKRKGKERKEKRKKEKRKRGDKHDFLDRRKQTQVVT